MKNELILIENNGVVGKYLSKEEHTIIEAVGTIAVPRESKTPKYQGIVIWSQDISVVMQVKAMKKYIVNMVL